VTPSAGAGGTMSPSAPQPVNYNATTSFAITPDTGYHISSISGCGGTSVGVQPYNASYTYSTGPITVDCTVTASLEIIPASEDFETGDLSEFPWATGGDGIWGVESSLRHNGDYAAQSPILGDNQRSYFELTLNATTADNVYFWYKVSSSAGDYLMFYVDGVIQGNWSGEVDWTYASYPVSTGQHTLRWEYSKGNSGSSGSDAGWVDNITFPTYELVAHTITASVGSGGTMTPTGLVSVYHGLTTQLTVKPDAGYHISSISGCGGTPIGVQPNNASYTYTTSPITVDCTVMAGFAINTYILSITKNGAGSDTVTSSPAGINCGAGCSATYNYGISVTLTASVNTDSFFTGWSGGGCSGAGSCTVTMDSDKTVTATFSKYITVTSPNGGENLPAGVAKTINWTYTGNPGTYVKIELYKGGTLSSTIITSTFVGSSGSGSYNWTIPSGQTPGADYQIKVSSATNTSWNDMSDASFAIVATYSISGTVTGAGTGVTVALNGASTATTTTDADGSYSFTGLTSGNYSFTGLTNGSYTITPSKTGYGFSPVNRGVTINGANVTGQNFTGTAVVTYSISGTVTGAGTGVTVALNGASTASTTTDASGNYSFTGLTSGSYTITPSKTGYGFSPVNRYTITPSLSWTYNSIFSPANRYTITPSLSWTYNSIFSPANRGVTINGANVTGQDFMFFGTFADG